MKYLALFFSILPLFTFAQKNIGIGTNNPNSRLHIHQDPSGVNPPSIIQLTSASSGSSSSDGLKVEMNGFSASIINKEAGLLSLGSGNVPSFNILQDGKLALNTTQMVGASDFTIRSRSDFWGGMYIDSPNNNNDGRPFYGYALDTGIKLFHYYDAEDSRFKFHFGGKSDPTFSFKDDGQFLINTTSAFNPDADFTIRSRGIGTSGGMYIETPSSSTDPLYGYAINGSQKVVHYYSSSLNSWVVRVGANNGIIVRDDGNVGLGEDAPEEQLVVDGRLRLKVSTTNPVSLNGTIVYNGENFYGRIGNSWHMMTNAGTTNSIHPNEEEITLLKAENEDLQKKLAILASRLDQLEGKIDK